MLAAIVTACAWSLVFLNEKAPSSAVAWICLMAIMAEFQGRKERIFGLFWPKTEPPARKGDFQPEAQNPDGLRGFIGTFYTKNVAKCVLQSHFFGKTVTSPPIALYGQQQS